MVANKSIKISCQATTGERKANITKLIGNKTEYPCRGGMQLSISIYVYICQKSRNKKLIKANINKLEIKKQ